jgi:hypothetical protein
MRWLVYETRRDQFNHLPFIFRHAYRLNLSECPRPAVRVFRTTLDYFRNLQHSHPEWLCLCFKRPKRAGRPNTVVRRCWLNYGFLLRPMMTNTIPPASANPPKKGGTAMVVLASVLVLKGPMWVPFTCVVSVVNCKISATAPRTMRTSPINIIGFMRLTSFFEKSCECKRLHWFASFNNSDQHHHDGDNQQSVN